MTPEQNGILASGDTTESKKHPLREKYGAFKKRFLELHDAHPRLFLLWCFALPAALMLIVHASFGVFPFGTNSVLVLDLNGQYVYFFEALRRAVYGDASLIYSFSRNLGGEFLGIYAYYLASPLSYLVCLFPKGMILEALYLMFVLKTGLCGLTFGYFLHKTTRLKRLTVILFSGCYALSGYGMIMQHNTMWTDCELLLPLVCLGVRALIREKKFKLFVSTLALAILANYYIGYMLCLFLVLYFFYCYFSQSPEERNPRGERLHFPRALARMGLFSAIGVLIACLIVLPAYYSLQFGKNTFSDPQYKFESKFALFDLFGMFLFNSYDTVRPEGMPIVYAGLLILICLPYFFLSHRFSVRDKLSSALVVFAMLFSFSIQVIDMVWHGFQAPNWLNYRYSFMLIFLLCVIAARAFDSFLENGPPRAAVGIPISLMLLIVVAQVFDYNYLNDYAGVYPNYFLLILYAVFLYLATSSRSGRRRMARRALTVLIVLEMFAATLLNLVHLHMDVVVSSRESYLSFSRKWQHVIDKIESEDPDPFYRTELVDHMVVNDPYSLGYYGLSGSTSTLNAAVIDLLFKMGVSAQSHWAQYCAASPVTDSLLGIRYIGANSGSEAEMPDLYEKIYDDGGASIYKNPYALPLAFPVNSMINGVTFNAPDKDADEEDTRTYYDNASPFERLEVMLRSMLGSEKALGVYSPIKASEARDNLDRHSVTTNHLLYQKKENSKQASLTFTIEGRGREVYARFPTLYLRSCHYYIYIDKGDGNGKQYVTGNWMLSGHTDGFINLGVVEEGETLTFKIILYSDDNRLYLYDDVNFFYDFDEAGFKDAFGTLNDGALEITSFSHDRISGTLTATEDRQTVFTTIPYDAGWQITVDGKGVDTYETLDTLLAFDVTPGEHTVEMRYMPKEYVLGFKLFLVGTISFAALIGAEFALSAIRKKKSGAEAPTNEKEQ